MGVILSAAGFGAKRRTALGAVMDQVRAGFLAPLLKTRGFTMTSIAG